MQNNNQQYGGIHIFNSYQTDWKQFIFNIVQKLIMDDMHKYAHLGIIFSQYLNFNIIKQLNFAKHDFCKNVAQKSLLLLPTSLLQRLGHTINVKVSRKTCSACSSFFLFYPHQFYSRKFSPMQLGNSHCFLTGNKDGCIQKLFLLYGDFLAQQLQL